MSEENTQVQVQAVIERYNAEIAALISRAILAETIRDQLAAQIEEMKNKEEEIETCQQPTSE